MLLWTLIVVILAARLTAAASLLEQKFEMARINMTIRDAECYSAPTTSSFSVLLVGLDFDNRPITFQRFESIHFMHDRSRGNHGVIGTVRSNASSNCFQLSHSCVPRADMMVIYFENTPDDPWAIDQIDVDVHFMLGPSHEDWHVWHFEHSILQPCLSWLNTRAAYQIGPRVGLIIQHDFSYNVDSNTFIRDWV
ncbi:hypothetical protein Angca_000039 [Angiostrongylus cantonensis]|nr:hypothetical protein Angca_000039 [Angiostrongylus cantonensis]